MENSPEKKKNLLYHDIEESTVHFKLMHHLEITRDAKLFNIQIPVFSVSVL